MKEIKYNRCGHEWETISKYIFVTRPSCLKKVEVQKAEKDAKKMQKM